MRVFLTGATGTVGTAILDALLARGHAVTALTRSHSSRQKARSAGAVPCVGDLRTPDSWIREAVAHDALVHTATTFERDMGHTDDGVVSALLEAVKDTHHPLRVLYTGGCWLYGATGDYIARDDAPFHPLPSFSWMVRNAQRLLACTGLSTAIVHPALVYHAGGGVFDRLIAAAKQGHPIEIWGSADIRWPLIHRRDLAGVYTGVLTRPDLIGSFNAVAETGVRVGDIADHIATFYGSGQAHVLVPPDTLVARHGYQALGPLLDQQMSAPRLRRVLGWGPQFTDFRTSDLFAR